MEIALLRYQLVIAESLFSFRKGSRLIHPRPHFESCGKPRGANGLQLATSCGDGRKPIRRTTRQKGPSHTRPTVSYRGKIFSGPDADNYPQDFETVPDGGVTLMLLGGALVGLGALRRRFRD